MHAPWSPKFVAFLTLKIFRLCLGVVFGIAKEALTRKDNLVKTLLSQQRGNTMIHESQQCSKVDVSCEKETSSTRPPSPKLLFKNQFVKSSLN